MFISDIELVCAGTLKPGLGLDLFQQISRPLPYTTILLSDTGWQPT